jgi:DNA-binding transcriptional regulator YdaS (Cro superfamily)
MLLADWLVLTATTKSAFAARIGVTPSAMTALTRGTKWTSARVARAIERETRSAVTVRDLLDAMQIPGQIRDDPEISAPANCDDADNAGDRRSPSSGRG